MTSPVGRAAAEFVGTGALLFGAVTASRWLFDPGGSVARVVPSLTARVTFDGLAMGALVCALIIAPTGRVSGGHLNPAMTVAFWALRALRGRDVAPYLAGQLLGAVTGTAAARAVWGRPVAERVQWARIVPHPGTPGAFVAVVEAASVVVLVLLTGAFLSRTALLRWTPVAVGAVVAVLITATGRATGGSFNPARAFGPETMSGQWSYSWCYLVAPLVGAVVAAAVRRRVDPEPLLACRLCGDASLPVVVPARGRVLRPSGR